MIYTIAFVSNVPVVRVCVLMLLFVAREHNGMSQRTFSTTPMQRYILHCSFCLPTSSMLLLLLLLLPLLLHHHFVLIRCQPCSPWCLTVNVIALSFCCMHACTLNTIHTHTHLNRESLYVDLMSAFASRFSLFLEHSFVQCYCCGRCCCCDWSFSIFLSLIPEFVGFKTHFECMRYTHAL